jgi:hypothetical protein
MNPPYAEFSRHLSHFLGTVVLDVLWGWVINEEMSDWVQGGCRICAEGIRLWQEATPADLARWGVADGQAWPPRLHTLASKWYHPWHVVVELGGLYLDGDGVSTRAELLSRWGRHIREPRLVPYRKERLARYRIRGDSAASAFLGGWLSRRFGPFRPALLTDEGAWSTPLSSEEKKRPQGQVGYALNREEAGLLLRAMRGEGRFWRVVERPGTGPLLVDRVDCQAAIGTSDAGDRAAQLALYLWERNGSCDCWDCASRIPEAATRRRARTAN